MIDDTELSECILQIDTREKSQSRIKRITDFWVSKGGMVELVALELGDYLISGSFRDKDIDLIIEYKTIADFAGSYEDLPRKLFEAGKNHRYVALFIEENDLALSFTPNGTFIKNSAVKDGSADVLNYYSYKNFLDTLSQDGIHCRVFRYESFFEEDVYSLLIHLTKDCHSGLHIKSKDYPTQFINMLCKMDGIGGIKAHKIVEIAPNLERLVELAHYEGVFEKVLGTLSGKKLRAFILNDSRGNECMTNYRAMFGISTEPMTDLEGYDPKADVKGCQFANPKNRAECKTKDNFKRADVQSQSLIDGKDKDGACEPKVGSNPAQPFYSGELAYLNENKSEFKEVEINIVSPKIHKSKSPSEDSSPIPQSQILGGDSSRATKGSGALQSSADNTTAMTTEGKSVLTPPLVTPLSLGDKSREGMAVTPSKLPVPPMFKPEKFKPEVIKSLGDMIVDCCYEKPISDTEIMRIFQMKGFKMTEIHKELIKLSGDGLYKNDGRKLYKYKQGETVMFSFAGIKADKELKVF